MAKWKKISRVVYQCLYHIVWCPKYRYRILEGAVSKFVEEKIRLLCEWKKSEILELNVVKDHVHAVVVIPPKVSIS
jgi:putative transposase